MRDVKADKIRAGGEHLKCGFEKDDGNGAVYIVVAVEKDWLARGDGAFDALDGGGHSEHEKGIVEVGRLGIQESEGFGCGGDATRNE
jgi:hypothetical protein